MIFSLLLWPKKVYLLNTMTDNQIQPQPQTTAEDALRQWWVEKYGTPIPDDAKGLIRTLIRSEVHRQRVQDMQLDDKTLHQIYESRRLCQAKLQHLADEIAQVRRQQDRLRQFQQLNTELTAQQDRLFQLNKEKASNAADQLDLDRFEEFEAVNGRFQRITTFKKSVRQGREHVKELYNAIDQVQKSTDDAEAILVDEQSKTLDALQQVESMAQTMAEVARQQAIATENQRQYREDQETLQLLQEHKTMLQKQQQENMALTEEEQNKLTVLRQKRQTLHAHQQTIVHSEAIMNMLDELSHVSQQRSEITKSLEQAVRNQEERDAVLARLFSDSQSMKAKIDAKHEEVEGHRRSIAGQNSYDLQRLALEQRSRRQMLVTAASLWRSIAAGYDLMEREEQEITRLRLHADHLRHDIDDLESHLRQTGKELEERTYQLTLSKSQNVIELRGDLVEGVPCTVCGAKNHPWQGESITEQNALIKSLNADCSLLKQEYMGKQEQLQELQADLTRTTSRLSVLTEQQAILQERQRLDIDEWQNFCTLDRTFADCSPSTNREARSTLLGLLIERAAVDAEEAERNLKAFSFHLDAISSLGQDIRVLQQQEGELATRLNEANTACQVMAGQVERLKMRLDAITQEYRSRYEALDHTITIPEWLSAWQQSSEGLKLRIMEMKKVWNETCEQLAEGEKQAAVLHEQAEMLHSQMNQVTMEMTACESHSASMKEQMEKALNSVEKLLPSGDGKGAFERACQQLNRQKELEQEARRQYDTIVNELHQRQAERKNMELIIQDVEQHIASEMRELDLWMGKYNMSHPPVQASELEEILVDGREWGEKRSRLRQIQVDYAVVQNRVDNLRAQIISLQAEGMRAVSDDGQSELALLRDQIEQLEEQQRDQQLQLAQLNQQLRAHEQATNL